MEAINLRSDTQTLPTEAMRDAIRNAQLGDDTYEEDPTVKKLEKMAAEKLGKEAALLVISGNMGNLVSMMTHCTPGDEVIIDPESHIFYYEVGGMANIAGLMPMPVHSDSGMLDPDEVAEAIRKQNLHYPIPRLLCLENTHNRSGGRVVPLELHKQLCKVAHKQELAVHLDGARIFNAAIASDLPASEFAKDVESVMFCLSKGLGCPLGSIVVGSKEFIEKANISRKRLGGGMRQAGVIAAAGIYALENNIERLADDHANAKYLAEKINEDIHGLQVDMKTVESNMVYIDHTPSGLDTIEVLKRFKGNGVIVSGRPPKHVRMVTNLNHDRAIIDEALERIRKAMK
jgi:threonine aldolase